MPDFSVDEITIEPYEYVSACRPSEIKDLIRELQDEGHLPKYTTTQTESSMSNAVGLIFGESLDVISNNRLKLTLEEEDYINNIAKRLR